MSAGEVPANPRVFQSIGQAWTNMWQWPTVLILVVFVLLESLLQVPSQIGQSLPDDAWRIGVALGGLSLVLAILVGGPLGMGIVRGHLKTSRGQQPEFADLAYGFKRYGQSVLLTLLTLLIIAIGFLLLIVPGIFLAIRLWFAAHRFVNDELSATDALQASWDDTRGRWWRTFGLALMAIPITIAGLLALGVGVLFAWVWIEQMMTVYWRSIEQA